MGAYLSRSSSEPPAQEASPLFEVTVILLVALLAAAAFVAFRRRAEPPAASHSAAPASGPMPPAGEAFVPRSAPRADAVDLSDVISYLRKPLQRALPEGIRLQVETAARLAPVRADRGQVELMVAHLVVHAADTMTEGGTVTIRTRAASAPPGDGEAAGDAGALIEVEGAGPIDAGLLPRLFEPLSTGGALDDGWRLELPTVQALAYHNHGTLRVDSGADGTRVAIVLPPMGEPLPDPGAFAARGRESVLVVEDDAAVRSLVRRTLEPAGYVIVEAADPRIALDILERGEPAVDLLLSDIVMEHMRGTELVRRVRARWPLVRILYMSGYGDDPAVRKEVARDGAELLAKPFTRDELLRAVRGGLDSLPGTKAVAGER